MFVSHQPLSRGQPLQTDSRMYWIVSLWLRFQIDLGTDEDDLGLHFNPRFHDDADGAVVVCNSKTVGCWGTEKRDIHNPLQRGSDVKVSLDGV